jgi:hypothetical protein
VGDKKSRNIQPNQTRITDFWKSFDADGQEKNFSRGGPSTQMDIMGQQIVGLGRASKRKRKGYRMGGLETVPKRPRRD